MSDATKVDVRSSAMLRSPAISYLLPFLLAIVVIAIQNPVTLVVLLTDGVWPVAIILSAAGWGSWPASRLMRDRENAGQEAAVAAALGFGLLGTATLVLGMCGALSRPIAIGLLFIGGVLGLARLRIGELRKDLGAVHGHANWPLQGLVLLPLALAIYVGISGAVLPPGVLWREEAGGYDVLEYHLQVQREYFDLGRIAFLPHNVYASFPQQIEIFYLLLMHLTGSPLDAAIPAQILHLLFGVLAVAAFAAWLPAGWPRVCGVAVLGCTPWLSYLGCLAYVENGLLFFGAITFGILTGWVRGRAPSMSSALVAGLCGGMAGGCKYTGLALIAVSGAFAVMLVLRKAWTLKARLFGAYFIAVAVGVSPWLVRNAIFTGNPVYPFAYRWFGGAAWSQEHAEQWSRGHAIDGGRAKTAAKEVFGLSARTIGRTHFGGLPFAVVFGCVLLNRRENRREIVYWLILAMSIAVVWAMTTQVAGRLAVPLVLPLAALVALAAERWRIVAGVTAFALAAIGGALVLGLWIDANSDWRRRIGVSLGDLAGRVELFVENHPYNALLSAKLNDGEKSAHLSSNATYGAGGTPALPQLWLVGDAAVFYVQARFAYFTAFNRDPWLEAARGRSPEDAVRWLRERGVRHVVFNWSEIERLRRTYGFSDLVTREWVDSLERAGLMRFAIPDEWAASLKSVAIYSVSSAN